VACARAAARAFLLLGPAQGGGIVDTRVGSRRVERTALATPSRVGATIRFVDGASGPRLYFRLDARCKPFASLAVDALANTLRERHRDDARFVQRLTRAAELMARLGATGQVDEDNEFDVALAAADVAWRSAGAVGRA